VTRGRPAAFPPATSRSVEWLADEIADDDLVTYFTLTSDDLRWLTPPAHRALGWLGIV
jgi:hypothetical protein